MGVFDLPSGGEIELLPVHEDFPACDRVTSQLKLRNAGTMSKAPAQQISSHLLTRRSQGLLKICNKLLLVESLSRLNTHPPTLDQSSSRSGWFIFQPQTWSQLCQDRLLFLPGILNMRETCIKHFCFRQQ